MNEHLDKSDYPLHRAWVDQWNGLVFVCLADEEPPPVGVLLERTDFSCYGLEAARVAVDREHVIDANWKVVWENALECYHCAINHPELKQIVQVVRDGPQPSDVQSGDFEYRPDYPMLPGRASFTIDGARKSGLPLGRATQVSLLQWHMCATELLACPDHAYIGLFRPLTATRTTFRMIILVHHDAVEGKDYNLEELVELQRVTRAQDDSLCERVQRGLGSPAFVPGPLNPSYEYVVRRFDGLYLDAIS
jgi:phenylpropionate dioxygenase-like ring-hydroxylating dioxygenase large terminal subunit